MDCLISLLLVSDLSQKHKHKKSLIIPGEQGRAGDVPYTIVKRKNRFFMLIHFHLQPAATASTLNEFRKLISIILIEQGRIHGNSVADGWAGAVVRKPLGIQKCYEADGRTDGRTDRHGKV